MIFQKKKDIGSQILIQPHGKRDRTQKYRAQTTDQQQRK